MKQGNIEWPLIRGAAGIFAVSLLISAILAGLSYYFEERMRLELQKNRSLFQGVSQKYLAVDEEEGYINDYYPEYRNLFEQGIIGREHRLNWIEVLRSSGEENLLPILDYQISTQNEHSLEYPIQLNNFKLYTSTMKLNLKLLHEGDLLNLLSDLNERAKGFYSVNSCEIVRLIKDIDTKVKKPNLGVECELNWFSIKKFDGSDLLVLEKSI